MDALKTRGRYDVILADDDKTRILVDRVTALHSVQEAEEVTKRLSEADIVTTAVGATILPNLAPGIAQGLVERVRRGGGPVNVIACENMNRWEPVVAQLRNGARPGRARRGGGGNRRVPERGGGQDRAGADGWPASLAASWNATPGGPPWPTPSNQTWRTARSTTNSTPSTGISTRPPVSRPTPWQTSR